MPGGAGQLIPLRAALVGLWLSLPGGLAAQPYLTESSDTHWQVSAPWFGGFSGLEISPDGNALTLITDRGSLVQADVTRTRNRITNITLRGRLSLKYRNRQNVRGPSADAEGLAISPQGAAYVSFEQHHRAATLDLSTGRSLPLSPIPQSDDFAENNGFEALALHPDGMLYALPEKPVKPATDFPLYCHAHDLWQVCVMLPPAGPFLPVGADFDADGTLYLLERAVTPLGFRTRIRRFDPRTDKWQMQTLLTTGPGTYGNLEGLSVWRDNQGILRLMTVSDDNFAPILHTQIVEFTLTE